MKREHLEHIIRAAAAIANQYEFVIVGSQSILGALPNAPQELLVSMEADIYPLNAPELWNLIDGAIGEGSPFNEHFGYYAQGVGPETATLPSGWKNRLVKIQTAATDLKIGWCLDPTDLAASKMAAGRPKDIDYVRTMLQHELIDVHDLDQRIRELPLPEDRIQILLSRASALSDRSDDTTNGRQDRPRNTGG